MNTFYKDEDAHERMNSYIGKNMNEIHELELKHFNDIKPIIDSKHDDFIKDSRKSMLTVQRLIDYLKTQDPNACILAYEPNSDAYIEQFPTLPSPDVLNVADAKKQMQEDLKSWYRNIPDAEQKIKDDMDRVFRYAEDTDVIIRFN